LPDTAEILEGFSRLEGVHGAFILDHEGHVRAEHLADFPDSSELAATVHRAVVVGSQVVASLGEQNLAQQFLEFADVQVIVEALEAGHVMAVVADPGSNLGRIRLELRKNKKAVESGLASREPHAAQDPHRG
jgi:predicted regulator of Ras-like GTPase activity (Roadblock/LC7/MglB family)